MRRVIILGGLGLFGRAAAEQLCRLGITVQTASRGAGADLRVDANNSASIRAALRKGDVIIDTAGPFQVRSMALVEAAVDIGFDVVDLNDSLSYAERLLELESRIAGGENRVLSAASTVSAVAAAVVRQSGVNEPVRVTAFLAPATRYTANAGVARSLVESIARPVRVWRDGRMQSIRGWSEPRRFPMPRPVGPVCGRLIESADALHLPRIWPSLRDVSLHVDTNTPGLNTVLQAASVMPGLRGMIARQMPWGTWIARRLGNSAGGVGYEIEAVGGKMSRYAVVAGSSSHVTAVAPAIVAARTIVENRFAHRGLVPPDRHVEPAELFEFLETNGIALMELK